MRMNICANGYSRECGHGVESANRRLVAANEQTSRHPMAENFPRGTVNRRRRFYYSSQNPAQATHPCAHPVIGRRLRQSQAPAAPHAGQRRAIPATGAAAKDQPEISRIRFALRRQLVPLAPRFQPMVAGARRIHHRHRPAPHRRLHHHDAGGAPNLPAGYAHHSRQAGADPARRPARIPVHQGRDPRSLCEPDTLWRQFSL